MMPGKRIRQFIKGKGRIMLYSDESNFDQYVKDGIRQMEVCLSARERVVVRCEAIMSDQISAIYGDAEEVTYG
jgi:hypothetical protein